MKGVFDVTDDYDLALKRGLSLSGEDQTFFAAGRVEWLVKCLACYDASPKTILDFGCGIGTATPFLLALPGSQVVGIDESETMLRHARKHESSRAKFMAHEHYRPVGEVDLVFCNGVFHHIPPSRRETAVRYIHDSLRPGGFLAFWENNPWNPGTRMVMRRISFDSEAKTLTPFEAQRLLKRAGFTILRTDFLFVFPRFLRWFRPLEAYLTRLPIGAQYQVLCRKD